MASERRIRFAQLAMVGAGCGVRGSDFRDGCCDAADRRSGPIALGDRATRHEGGSACCAVSPYVRQTKRRKHLTAETVGPAWLRPRLPRAGRFAKKTSTRRD